jgi:hypothetical protein
VSQSSLFDLAELPLQLTPPAAFRRLPRRLETEFCCPRCGYAWGGNPRQGAADADAELESA